MDATFFKKLLDQNSFGYAFLNQDLRIRTHNRHLARFSMRDRNLEMALLTDLFPETVGLDQIFEEIFEQKRFSFELTHMNRESDEGQTIYFNFFLYGTGNKDIPYFFLVEDKTREAELAQELSQRSNEIRLLEGLLSARSGNVSARIWGQSLPIENLRAQIEKMGRIPTATILLQGESGTGKSMAARVLHESSHSSDAPFIEINCAAIPETLLESELFGYNKGAFTNAVTDKKGLLEEADGGTLFLDEIGEMSLPLQAKLLSFLETRKFRSLGSTSEKEVKIRLIAATNQDLGAMVKERRFREDLFYRLNVVRIQLPPLRDLGDDILIIAQNFILTLAAEFKKPVNSLDKPAANKLLNHNWPGNIRELRNAIERALIFCEGQKIGADDLHLGSLQRDEPSSSPLDRFKLPKDGLAFAAIEKKLLEDALKMSNGNQSRAAQLLQLSRDTFRYRLEKHDLI